MKQPIIVQQLTIKVVTGDTPYAREGGFSSLFAEMTPEGPQLIDQLASAHQSRQAVTLRCAMLDTTGRITNSIQEAGKKKFIQVIDDITYRKPGRT
jgi:hypothetical protein